MLRFHKNILGSEICRKVSMPNIKSAAKRLRQSKVRQARNRSAKSELKTMGKKVKAEAVAGKVADAEANLVAAAKRLDKAAAKGIIHRNAAARKKSRLQKAIKAAKSK
jgi:small subunit ribosomal protein S20